MVKGQAESRHTEKNALRKFIHANSEIVAGVAILALLVCAFLWLIQNAYYTTGRHHVKTVIVTKIVTQDVAHVISVVDTNLENQIAVLESGLTRIIEIAKFNKEAAERYRAELELCKQQIGSTNSIDSFPVWNSIPALRARIKVLKDAAWKKHVEDWHASDSHWGNRGYIKHDFGWLICWKLHPQECCKPLDRKCRENHRHHFWWQPPYKKTPPCEQQPKPVGVGEFRES
jgi:hypothetical protein